VGYVFAVIAALAILALAVKYMGLKRQVRNIGNQLRAVQPRCNSISVALADCDIERLALEINRLNADYQKAILDAEKSGRALRDSIADISHDMRTPLTAAIGYLQLLEKCGLDDEQRQYLTISLEKSHYLRKLIDDFYELSILNESEPALELQKIDLAGIVSEVILDNADGFENGGIAPIFETAGVPAFILGDDEKLRRIMQNILSNCLKYSCGDVTFKIATGDFVTLTVENSAATLDEIDTERLFDRFYKADSARNARGTGLGLSIAKLLMENMGGRISAYVSGDVFGVKLAFPKPSDSI
jgi:signal transduction histidine kinase